MRKSEKKWKSERDNKQTRLFVGPENAPNQRATGGTGDVAGGVMDLLSRLAEQRTLTEHLLERIVDYKNLKEADEQVRRNDGSAGVDGMSVKELENWLVEHLAEFCRDVLSEQYEISPVRKVEIPKPNGGTRTD